MADYYEDMTISNHKKRYVTWTDEKGLHHKGEFLCIHQVIAMEVPNNREPLTTTDGLLFVSMVTEHSAVAYVINSRNGGSVICVPATWLKFEE